MANPFKEKQAQAKLDRLLSDCAKTAEKGGVGLARAIADYAKGAGVSREVAERALSDRRSIQKMDFRNMFQPR